MNKMNTIIYTIEQLQLVIFANFANVFSFTLYKEIICSKKQNNYLI